MTDFLSSSFCYVWYKVIDVLNDRDLLIIQMLASQADSGLSIGIRDLPNTVNSYSVRAGPRHRDPLNQPRLIQVVFRCPTVLW